MDGTAVLKSPPTPVSNDAGTRTTTGFGQHALYLTILVLLAGAVRFWLVGHTEVAARDSIGYIRYALELESQPWSDVIRASEQHPGYPAALLAVSWPVRHWLHGTTPRSMQLSAQLATIVAALLLVFPLYFLGCELYSPRIAFWGAALFQCLPATARTTADGLSEGVFFLFAVSALWLAARALRTNSLVTFVLCGLIGGLAYLTRPEGALVVGAAGLALLGLQAVPTLRRSWPRVAVSGCCLGLAALLAGSPYFLVTGKFTNKPTPIAIIGGPKPDRLPNGEISQQIKSDAMKSASAKLTDTSNESVGPGPLLAIYAPPTLRDRRIWALKAVGSEVIQAYQYVLGIPLVLGIWFFRRSLMVSPGAWVLAILCLLQIAVLWRLALVMAYVSERHVLMLVLCGVFTIAAALDWLGGKLAASRINFLHAGWAATVPLAVLTFCWLPVTLKPLHANRAGHKAAGQWLAKNADPNDDLVDPFCWAHYYAGRVFLEHEAPRAAPPDFKKTRYAVLDAPDKEHPRLPTMPTANEIATTGRLVYSWPENKPANQAKVFVYAVQGGK